MRHMSCEEGIARIDGTRYGYCIVKLCHGVFQNQDFYAFVAIEPQNLVYFQTHYKTGQYTSFRPFGAELLRGWGEKPSEDIIKHLCAKFDVHFCDAERSVQKLTNIIRRNVSHNDLSLLDQAHANLEAKSEKNFETEQETVKITPLESLKQSLEKPKQLSLKALSRV